MELVTSRDFLDYRDRSDEECHGLIKRAKASLGEDLVILGHHYQRADVYQHADLRGGLFKALKTCIPNKFRAHHFLWRSLYG